MFILKPLDGAPTPLLALFNEYLKGLRVLAMASEPRDCFAEIERGENSQRDALIFFRLAGLRAALESLHQAISDAHKELTKFYEDHAGDFCAYAVATRAYLLEEFGGEPSDWVQNGTDAAGEPIWDIVQRPLAEVEAEYGILAELARFFPNDEQRGEFIGSSAPTDYECFTLMVAQQSQFGFRQMFARAGTEIPVYHRDENGEMIKQTLADQIESELNEDIQNEQLVDLFRTVIFGSCICNELFTSPSYEPAQKVKMLHSFLGYLLQVDTKNLSITPSA